ncbi:sterol desaturase family protein [Psychromonas ossibalaenae]|uniref:sterol desaturase family protein n=1 Tax=Psychromonas ossibalaenae TaxID=444922 RepID=UPI000365455A|nr:sterol desaturase family protein [Psychromonas ossibalaenae]
MNILLNYEHAVRLGMFLSLFIILAGIEFLFPLAERKCGRLSQWSVNLSLAFLAGLFLNILVPLLAVGVALSAAEHSIGLFNIIDIPYAAAVVFALLMLDLLIYGQHVLMHKIPLLWSVHRMHHTEIGLDVSSAVRFHPIEIIISMLIKMLFVVIFGIPAGAVIIFEVLLNALALFNHSNLKLPKAVDKHLRKFIVTPEVHWIHHSDIAQETNSNYGFNLILWDKLFSTYRDKPAVDYPLMRQGLSEFGVEKPLSLYQLLMLPFQGNKNV